MIYANSDIHPRTMKTVKSTCRKRCDCGCTLKASHIGLANETGMIIGCELIIRRWVRDGWKSF